MVSRENQSLQIALVIFVVLTIASAVSCFVFFSKYDEERSKVARAESALRTADGKTEVALTELKEMKAILGVKSTDSLQAIQELRKSDLAALPGNMTEKSNYRDLARQLANTLGQKDGMIIAGQKREIKLGDKIVVDEATKVEEIGEYKEEFNEASEDYLGERHNLKRDADEAARAKIAAFQFFEKRQGQFDQDVLALKSYTQNLEAQVKEVLAVNEQLFARIRQQEPDSELVDARVQWVHQGQRLIWLDKGSADGLRQQVTFKVVDRDEPNPAPARSKATIEVIRVTEPHAAEARIISDEPTNPILPGDLLFSAVWQPGRVEHFALTGFMDLNHDGESDRTLVRQLIERSGGMIDAEVTDDGRLIGQLSVDTKYLIEGVVPTDRSAAEVLKNHAIVRKQANYQCVKVLSVGKFLDYVGYRPSVQTVALDRRARSEDFKPRLPDVPRKSIGAPINFNPLRPKPKATTY